MPRFRNTTSSIIQDTPSLDLRSHHRLNDDTSASIGSPESFPNASNERSSKDDVCASPSLTQQPTPHYTPSPLSRSTRLPSPTSPTDTPYRRKHASSTNITGHIPRPRNAFILFRSHALANGLVDIVQQNEASREIARLWRGAASETRTRFEGLAFEEKQRHAAAHPDYKYAPKKVGCVMTAPAKTKVASTRRERKKSTSLPKGVNTHPRPPPIKIKRTIPTPDPTPEPSPEPMEVDSDVDEDSEEDTPLYDLFSGVFESIPKPNMRVVDGEEICIPEFSYPSEDSHLVIDSGRVPCLASSSFYSPTAVQGVRVRNVASGSIEDERNPNERFLRPTAPIWHAEADFNYWDDPMMATDSSRAYDPCSSMGTIDVAAEQRALTVFLDDSF